MKRNGRRLLTLTWYTFGYWAVALGVAGFAGRNRGPVRVLAVFAALWLAGVVWAAVNRKRTVLARVVGLVLAALPVVGSKLGNPDMEWVEVGDWFVRARPDRFARAMLIALGFLAVVALLQVLFARAIRIQARRRGLDPARPRWHAFVFPLVFAAALLIVQCFSHVAVFVLCAGATVWLFGMLGAVERREPLKARWVGLALALLLIGGWPPVPLDAFDAEIAVAVLRYEMADADGPCFVEVRGEDPSADVLRGLADLDVRIRPVSAAVLPNWQDDESPRYVTDRDTSESGVVYRIASIRRSRGNPMTVAVEGSTYLGPLAADGGTYYVAWLFGYWVVVDYDLHWVS